MVIGQARDCARVLLPVILFVLAFGLRRALLLAPRESVMVTATVRFAPLGKVLFANGSIPLPMLTASPVLPTKLKV